MAQQLLRAGDHSVDAVCYRRALIAWGKKYFRTFPWRLTEDPYCILMAEIMLHRTQACQVEPVYERFIEQYDNILALSQAPREELNSALFSLGLRWRIDLIHQMVEELIARFDGQIPHKKADLLSLPGVSNYISSAIRCFAWNQAEPLIDTNTVRVVGRVFGLNIKDSSRRNQSFRELITALVDPYEPRLYNYALLDLADQVCTKKRPPDCAQCPIIELCLYGSSSPTIDTNSGLVSNK
jgi:A/G-specific adenine glycosylase